MRILVLGGDGYLGWPTAMYLSNAGHSVAVMDNFAKRGWETELGIEPLFGVRTLHDRVKSWREVTGKDIELFVGDLRDYSTVETVLQNFAPESIVHYGEQPSAPYSMIDYRRAAFTQENNIVGTLNVLFAIKKIAPKCHLVKLGTMGEYGTPNIDIEEGFIEIEHKGRKETLPFPCQPGSFYHLSKVHDSHNIRFACKIWKLASTDLHQGVVYGIETNETKLDPRFETSFHYDEVFGTALNRFCLQAVVGMPLTIYGKGGQKRGFLNIKDTLRCVELAILHPAQPGEYRVFNQFTETFTVAELAALVAEQSHKLGMKVKVQHCENPRIESEDHYYNPVHTKLLSLGLRPHLLSEVLIQTMLSRLDQVKFRANLDNILPKVRWADGSRSEKQLKLAGATA